MKNKPLYVLTVNHFCALITRVADPLRFYQLLTSTLPPLLAVFLFQAAPFRGDLAVRLNRLTPLRVVGLLNYRKAQLNESVR